MNEAELESSINEYKQQLCQVEAAIHFADSSMLDDLLKLQGDLKELINLSQESLQSLKNNVASQNQPGTNSPSNTVDFDAEMALFQSEIASIDSEYQVTNAEVDNNLDKHLDQAESSKSKSNINTDLFSQPNHSNKHLGEAESSKSKSSNNEDLFSQLLSMEGMKCRAIYSTEYGNLGYHNAVIHKIQLEKDVQSVEDVQVRVMFSHPCVLDMKPCSYYLDDRCNYGADRCKFSHGHVVPFTDIREYVEPNYNRLKAGGRCLVAATSGLWKPAVIQGREEGPDNETIFIVQLGQTNTTTTVTSSEILPLGSDDSSDEDSKEDDDDIIESKSWNESDTTNNPPPVRSINQTSISFGSWEKHTKGIGSRLMEKMGYVHGQGLGKSGEGRLEPIEAVVLPQGKSLDKCMELKALSSNPVVALQKLKKKEKEQKRIAAGYHKQQKKYSVFDFLNKKLGDLKKDDNQKLKNSKNKSVNLKTATDKSLNVQGLKLSQEIRDITINITKLQQSFQVNQTRDKVVASSIMKKIESQQNKLHQLKRAEGLLENEQANRTSKQKLTIF